MHERLKLILLDRDGVLNVDHGYVHKWEDWEWCHGAKESLKALTLAGYQWHIVTNQSGVGRGLFSQDDYITLMRAVRQDYILGHDDTSYENIMIRLTSHGLVWHSVCFHNPTDGCDCRKPKTGMWSYIDKMFSEIARIDKTNSWFLDDKLENLEFGRGAGVNPVLINRDHTGWAKGYDVHPTLHQFAQTLLGREIPWQKRNRNADVPRLLAHER